MMRCQRDKVRIDPAGDRKGHKLYFGSFKDAGWDENVNFHVCTD